MPRGPNIVFILMDNVGYGERRCYGRRYHARRGDVAHRRSSPPKGRARSTSTSKRSARRAAGTVMGEAYFDRSWPLPDFERT